MISKVFEWLRAADLKPDDGMVTSRTSAIEDLENKIRESPDFELLLGTVTAAVGGCERLGEQSPEFRTLLDCVLTHSPAFPPDITENSLHLRILSCLGIGQLLSSGDEESDNDELLIASLLMSGLGLKPKEPGKHLDKIFDELEKTARSNLQVKAVALRERQALDWSDFNLLEGLIADPAAFNKQLLPAVKGLVTELLIQQQADREELEVMWWLHNGYSERIAMSLKSASAFLAAATIGIELAERVVAPATVGLSELVAHASIRDRTAAQIKPKSLKKVFIDLGDTGIKLLLPSTQTLRTLAKQNGSLFPLSWLSIRLEDSQGADGWEPEFRKLTGVSADHEITPGALAAQVFAERQAQKAYHSIVSGLS